MNKLNKDFQIKFWYDRLNDEYEVKSSNDLADLESYSYVAEVYEVSQWDWIGARYEPIDNDKVKAVWSTKKGF